MTPPPPPPPPPEERLALLARRCGARGWAAAYGMLRHADDAHDAVQQAFVVAARKPHRIPPDDPWPWFRRVVSLEARNLRRKRRPRTNVDDIDGPLLERCDGDEPIDRLERVERTDRLHAAIRRLPRKEREIVLLTHVAGLSHATAADVLGMPRATLTWHLVRARERLRRALRDTNEGIRAGLAALAPAAPFAGGDAAGTGAWADVAQTLAEGVVMTSKWTVVGGLALSVGLGAVAGVSADRAGWLDSTGGEGVTAESAVGRAGGMGSEAGGDAASGPSPVDDTPELRGADLAGRLSIVEAENARLRVEAEELRARIAATESDAEARRPTFTFGAAGRLEGVREADWAALAMSSDIVNHSIRAVADHKARGESPPRDLLVALQQNVEKMRTYEYAVLDRLPTSAKFNGEFTHPITIANLVAGTLERAGRPLTEAQIAAISELGERFERDHDAARARFPEGTLRTERILDEMRRKARFLADVLAVLDDEQRRIASPPETRNVAGLDLLCPTLMVVHTNAVLPGANDDAVVAKARTLLLTRLSLDPEEAAILDEPLARWRATWGDRLRVPAPLHRAGHYTLDQALEAGELTLSLYRDLLTTGLPSDAARAAIVSDPGFLVPRLLTE